MSNHNVPHINEDVPDLNKMPHDSEPVDDEGTAPPVKSGYKPKVVKSTKPSTERTFTNFKVLNRNSVQATVPAQKTFSEKAYEKTLYTK